MGDGRILEWTAGFIDTLPAACRLPVQGNRTKIVGIHTKIQKGNQQSGQLICKNGLPAFFYPKWRFYNGSDEENHQYQSIF